MKSLLAVMLPLLAAVPLYAAELPLAAKIDAVNGEVSARASSAASWVAVQNGTMLAPGGEVRTGKGASAVVVFSDNNKVRLNSATVFAIDGATTLKTELRLISGRFTAWVKRANKADFRVRHLAGVAAVRGTVLEGEGTDAGITFSLLEGKMDVTDAFGNTSSLNPGQSTNLTQAGGQPGRDDGDGRGEGPRGAGRRAARGPDDRGRDGTGRAARGDRRRDDDGAADDEPGAGERDHGVSVGADDHRAAAASAAVMRRIFMPA